MHPSSRTTLKLICHDPTASGARVVCVPNQPTPQRPPGLAGIPADMRDDCYHASAEQLLALLSSSPLPKTLLLIGHNPGLEDLIDLLIDDATVTLDKFPTAACAWLQCDRLAPGGHAGADCSGHERLFETHGIKSSGSQLISVRACAVGTTVCSYVAVSHCGARHRGANPIE